MNSLCHPSIDLAVPELRHFGKFSTIHGANSKTTTTRHRKIHGPLRPDTVDVVNQFYRCGDLAAGFTRILCPDCLKQAGGFRLEAGGKV